MKKFIMLGIAGYIAEKHLEAIKAVGGYLVAAHDPSDSVGILDKYFPGCKYFQDFHRFDRYVEDMDIDYVVICTPNYMHHSQCLWGLHLGADVICEKPLTLNLNNAEKLLIAEEMLPNNIYSILQLRYCPIPKEFLTAVDVNKVEVRYSTPRGDWYHHSWKGDESKSGGLITNIGIHLFDYLIFNFGQVINYNILHKTSDIIIGNMLLDYAEVEFRLSISRNDGYERVFTVDGNKIDFTAQFGSLHYVSYASILQGDGWGVRSTFPSIDITERIRKGIRCR